MVIMKVDSILGAAIFVLLTNKGTLHIDTRNVLSLKRSRIDNKLFMG